jgi:hypothetical protein
MEKVLLAAELEELLAGSLVPIISTAIVFIWLTIMEYLGHKENMKRLELIEKGLWKPEYEKREALGAGCILAGIGVAIFVGSFWIIWENVQWLRLGGLIIFFLGIALVTYDRIKIRELRRKLGR